MFIRGISGAYIYTHTLYVCAKAYLCMYIHDMPILYISMTICVHVPTFTNILIYARIHECVQGLMLQAAPGGAKRKRDGEEGGDSQDKPVTSPRGEKRGDDTYEARCVCVVCVCVCVCVCV